jgi:hypothetical protein
MKTKTVARDFAVPLAVAAAGALGAIPSRSGSDPVALVAWISIWSAAGGFLCASGGVRRLAFVALPPAAWMVLVAGVDAASPRDLPSAAWAALAWSGLFAGGFGVGRLAAPTSTPTSASTSDSGIAGACVLFLIAALLAALPILPGRLGAPLSPPVEARLLDLSPATLVEECAGLDWMRHPAIYDAAGSADIDPSLRLPYRGRLAGPITFVVGCLLAAIGEGIARARAKRPTNIVETSAWPSTNTSAPSPRT